MYWLAQRVGAAHVLPAPRHVGIAIIGDVSGTLLDFSKLLATLWKLDSDIGALWVFQYGLTTSAVLVGGP